MIRLLKKIRCTIDFRFTKYFTVLIFAEREDQKTIPVLIKRDNIPELSETIKVQLLGVQLVSALPLNYSVIHGLQLNTPPTINSAKSEVQIVIKENDEARGIIRFTQSAMVVREEIGTAVLQLVREGWLTVTKLVVAPLCLFYTPFTRTKHVELNQVEKKKMNNTHGKREYRFSPRIAIKFNMFCNLAINLSQ